jgi:hypothetical protein
MVLNLLINAVARGSIREADIEVIRPDLSRDRSAGCTEMT